jgi:hypothetical protein
MLNCGAMKSPLEMAGVIAYLSEAMNEMSGYFPELNGPNYALKQGFECETMK